MVTFALHDIILFDTMLNFLIHTKAAIDVLMQIGENNYLLAYSTHSIRLPQLGGGLKGILTDTLSTREVCDYVENCVG